MRNIRRRAAHIEAERMREARAARRRRHADNTTGWAGKHGVAAAKSVGVRQAAIRLHEQELPLRTAGILLAIYLPAGSRRSESMLKSIHIGPQHGRKVR